MPHKYLKSIHERNERIQDRLDDFVYKRAFALSIASGASFIGYMWVLQDGIAHPFVLRLLSVLAVLLNLYRIQVTKTAIEDESELNKSLRRLKFGLVTLTISSLWIAIYAIVNFEVGNNHPSNLLALLIISGLIGGTPSSLGPMQTLAVTNTILLGLSASISTIINGSTIQDYVLAALAAVYTVLMVKYAKDFRVTLGLAMQERNAAESEMNAIKTLINSVPGLMTILDANLNYVIVNDAFRKSIQSNVIGQKVGHLSESPDFKTLVEEFAASSLDRKMQEMKMGPSFQQQHYLVSMTKIHSPFEGIAILTMNIEDRVRIELELSKARQEMEHASRLIALGEMMSSVSHEIRNPLTIISGKASTFKMIASKRELDRETVDKEADVIIKMVDRIAKIIQNTLRFSRGDNDTAMKPTTIRQLIDDATSLTAAKLKVENVELRLRDTRVFDEVVECQSLTISQVLVNLVNNAVDAMEGQKEKWISIEARELDGKIQIRVSDGGPGIPDDIKEKIMQPFFTTKPDGKGTGLGLSISQNIISNHKGQMYLAHDAKHTTFVLELWKKIPQCVSQESRKAS